MASPDPSVLDGDQLAQYGDDAEFIKELLEQFEVEYTENMESLARSLRSGDHATAYLAAHTIKGVCGNVGAKQLYNLSTTLSNECRDLKEAGATAQRVSEITRLVEQLHQHKGVWDRVVAQYLASFA